MAAQNDIASLSVKIKADIGQLQRGLSAARREIDVFNRKADQSQSMLESKWGVVRGMKRGGDIGRQFGSRLASGIDSSLKNGKSVWDYLTKDNKGSTRFKQDVSVVSKALIAGFAGLTVGGTINAFNGLKSVISGISSLKPNQLFNSIKQGFKSIQGLNIAGVTKYIGNTGSKIFGKLGGITLGGYELGKNFGERFTNGIEKGWSKLRGKPVPIRFNEHTTAAQLQARGIKANLASRISNVTSEPGYLNILNDANRMKYLISRLQQLGNTGGPNTKRSKSLESEVKQLLTYDSVYKRIKDTITGIKFTDIKSGISSIGSSIKGGVSNLFTPKLYTTNTGQHSLQTGQPIITGRMQTPFSRGIQNMWTGAGKGIGGIIKSLDYMTHYGVSGFSKILTAGTTTFSGLYDIASGVSGKLFSVFQTLNPFEMFTRSLMAFKTTAVIAIGAIVAESIKLSGEFEQFRIGFEALTGSAKMGSQVFDEMSQLAAKTPFAIREVMSASKMLLGYGTAAEQLYPTLKMLGDVTSAIGNDYVNLQHVTYLFGTMQQQGHVFTRDINQLANIGIPIYEELGKVMGVNKQRIQGLVEEGKVGFPEVQKAFINMTKAGSTFGGFMEKQSKSLLGLWRNLLDNLEIAGGKFGDILVKEFDLKGVLDNLTTFTKNSDKFFSSNADNIKFMVDVLKSGAGYAREFAIHLGAGVKILGDLGGSLFPETFKFMEKLAKGGKDLSSSWDEAKNNMISVFESIAKAFARMMDFIEKNLYSGINDMNKLMDPFGLKNLSNNNVVDSKFGNPFENNDMTNLKRNRNDMSNEVDRFGRIAKTEDERYKNTGDIKFKDSRDLYLGKQKEAMGEYDKLTGLIELNRNNKREELLGKDQGYYLHHEKKGTYEEDVSKFFGDFRNTQNNTKLREIDRDRIKNEVAPPNIADMLIGSIGPAMRQQKNEHIDREIGKHFSKLSNVTEDQMNSLQMLTGGLPSGYLTAGIEKTRNDIGKRYDNPVGYPLTDRSINNNPDFREVTPAIQTLTHAMVELVNELTKYRTPLEQLKEGIVNLDTPLKSGDLTKEQHARGMLDLYHKVGERIGDNTAKFANPIYKGSSEDLTVQAKSKMGLLEGQQNAQQMMQKIMEDALEVEKQQAAHLKTVVRILEEGRAQSYVDWLGGVIKKLGPGG